MWESGLLPSAAPMPSAPESGAAQVGPSIRNLQACHGSVHSYSGNRCSAELTPADSGRGDLGATESFSIVHGLSTKQKRTIMALFCTCNLAKASR